MSTSAIWTYRSLRGGIVKTTPLALNWEVEGDPITDDYTPDEISAEDLLAPWARTRGDKEWAQISWFIAPAWEGAPFSGYHEDFLTYFTWPVNGRGERLQWARLHVEDKLWHTGRAGRARRGDKGGFIQEATGWKPGAFQDRVHVGTLLAAAGFAS